MFLHIELDSSQRAHSALSHEHVKAGIVCWSPFIVEHDNHFQMQEVRKHHECSALGDIVSRTLRRL